MSYLLTIIGIIIVAGIFITNSDNQKKDEHIKTLRDKMSEVNVENPIIGQSPSLINGMLLDKKNKVIYTFHKTDLTNFSDQDYTTRIIKFENILESEVIIDNESIIKTSKGSMVGGAIAGGILAGGVGAIIGGTTGTKTSSDIIRNIDLKITINDIENPICKLNFLSDMYVPWHTTAKYGYKKDSKEYITALNEVEKWHGMIEVIMNQNTNKLS